MTTELVRMLASMREKAEGAEQALERLSTRLMQLDSEDSPPTPPHFSGTPVHCEMRGAVADVIINPSTEAGALALEILRLMAPQDVANGTYVRIGNEADGGYVMLDHGLDNTVAYSFGISDDVSWDQGMVDRGCDIFQFDHTIDALPYEHERFHWSKLGIGGKTEGEFISVHDIMANNGHLERSDLVLQMDIEGGEWGVLETIDPEDLSRFSQIVVELHWYVTGGEEHMRRAIAGLQKINETHQSIHFHANNWGWLGIIGGVSLPDVFEVTFARRSDHEFLPCTRSFPTELDRACRKDAPDYLLRI